MIGFEVVASVVLFVLLATVTAMAILGLLGAGGAIAVAICPQCRHLSVTTSTWHYCPHCAPGALSRFAQARLLHPHWRVHPHWPRTHHR